MGDEIQEFFQTAKLVAEEAGRVVKEAFYNIKNIEVKTNFADLVTETDKAVEDMIIAKLTEKYPSHKFIGEETVSAGNKCELTDDPTWIIDPIDGTTNFVHGIPHTCISIGLAVDKQIVAGIVHCPIVEEMYTAVKGQGAFCNGKKLAVSAITEISKSAIIAEGGTSRDPVELQTKMDNTKSLIQKCHGVRMYGSAAMNMCMVARGSHEAYLEYGIHVWDIAAGKLVVEEAGGVVVDPTCAPIDIMNRRVLAACSQNIADEISKAVAHITLERD